MPKPNSSPGPKNGQKSSPTGENSNPIPMPSEWSADMIKEVFSGMKKTLGVLEDSLESLGDNSGKFVELSPAIEAAAQVAVLDKQSDVQMREQAASSDQLAALVENVLKSLSDDLSSRLDSIVAEIVEKKIEERVRSQLNSRIPEEIPLQSQDLQRQILEVQAELHNSEARRYHATLRESPFSLPLRPLLRPLATPLQSPSSSRQSIPPTPTTGDGSTTPTTTTSTSEDFPLTPSPLFPRDMAALFKLGPDEARMLVKDYGLEGIPEEPDDVQIGGGTNGTDNPDTPVASPTRRSAEESATRERDLSRFMAHIGVPFRMVPQKSSRKDRVQLPPLIINC